MTPGPQMNAAADWLRRKLADAEKSLHAREQSEQCWRGGDDESWNRAAKLTGQRPMSKALRTEAAECEKRIAGKCRLEVEMFKGLLATVEAAAIPDAPKPAPQPLCPFCSSNDTEPLSSRNDPRDWSCLNCGRTFNRDDDGEGEQSSAQAAPQPPAIHSPCPTCGQDYPGTLLGEATINLATGEIIEDAPQSPQDARGVDAGAGWRLLTDDEEVIGGSDERFDPERGCWEVRPSMDKGLQGQHVYPTRRRLAQEQPPQAAPGEAQPGGEAMDAADEAVMRIAEIITLPMGRIPRERQINLITDIIRSVFDPLAHGQLETLRRLTSRIRRQRAELEQLRAGQDGRAA